MPRLVYFTPARLEEFQQKTGADVIGPAHVISLDIPWENIVAFFEAVDEYGQGDRECA